MASKFAQYLLGARTPEEWRYFVRHRPSDPITAWLVAHLEDTAQNNFIPRSVLYALRKKMNISPPQIYFDHVGNMDKLFMRIANHPVAIGELSKSWNGKHLNMGPEIGTNDTDVLYEGATDPSVLGSFLRALSPLLDSRANPHPSLSPPFPFVSFTCKRIIDYHRKGERERERERERESRRVRITRHRRTRRRARDRYTYTNKTSYPCLIT